MKSEMIKNMTLAAMFLAIGLFLPFLTGQIPQFGNMMLPMHIPVILCGLICGWKYGLMIGFILPGFRFLLFGSPPFLAPFPVGLAMTFELATYGFLTGFLYQRSRWQCLIALYRAMITAMVAGRIVWGAVMFLLVPLGLNANGFTFGAFMSGAILTAIPGIIIQLTLIPALMVTLNRTGLVKFHKEKPASLPTPHNNG